MFVMTAVMNAKFLFNVSGISFRLTSCAVSFTSATQGASSLSGNVGTFSLVVSNFSLHFSAALHRVHCHVQKSRGDSGVTVILSAWRFGKYFLRVWNKAIFTIGD